MSQKVWPRHIRHARNIHLFINLCFYLPSYLSIYLSRGSTLCRIYTVGRNVSTFITGSTLCPLYVLGRPYVTPKYGVDLVSGRPFVRLTFCLSTKSCSKGLFTRPISERDFAVSQSLLLNILIFIFRKMGQPNVKSNSRVNSP